MIYEFDLKDFIDYMKGATDLITSADFMSVILHSTESKGRGENKVVYEYVKRYTMLVNYRYYKKLEKDVQLLEAAGETELVEKIRNRLENPSGFPKWAVQINKAIMEHAEKGTCYLYGTKLDQHMIWNNGQYIEPSPSVLQERIIYDIAKHAHRTFGLQNIVQVKFTLDKHNKFGLKEPVVIRNTSQIAQLEALGVPANI